MVQYAAPPLEKLKVFNVTRALLPTPPTHVAITRANDSPIHSATITDTPARLPLLHTWTLLPHRFSFITELFPSNGMS